MAVVKRNLDKKMIRGQAKFCAVTVKNVVIENKPKDIRLQYNVEVIQRKQILKEH